MLAPNDDGALVEAVAVIDPSDDVAGNVTEPPYPPAAGSAAGVDDVEIGMIVPAFCCGTLTAGDEGNVEPPPPQAESGYATTMAAQEREIRTSISKAARLKKGNYAESLSAR